MYIWRQDRGMHRFVHLKHTHTHTHTHTHVVHRLVRHEKQFPRGSVKRRLPRLHQEPRRVPSVTHEEQHHTLYSPSSTILPMFRTVTLNNIQREYSSSLWFERERLVTCCREAFFHMSREASSASHASISSTPPPGSESFSTV